MRLSNTTTFALQEFFADIPKYAILSHTWGDHEVSFQDIQGEKMCLADPKLGARSQKFAKIKDSCEKAASHGYEFIWIDTCCIDKTSSSELSEAINSRYCWYQTADICYVYLSDADALQEGYDVHRLFLKSRWYTRGWTLQMLLAPQEVYFYDRNWVFVGTKAGLLQEISKVTGIELYALQGGDLQRLTVARRMSWMADRKTTRTEDMAYCLLGIFAISMPLLYGEGHGAFIRLQEEIIRSTEDQTLFAWQARDRRSHVTFKMRTLFASSPSLVHWPKSIAQFRLQRTTRPWSATTNKGLQLHALLGQDNHYSDNYFMVLDCPIGFVPGALAGIKIKRSSTNRNEYARVGKDLLTIEPRRTTPVDWVEGFNLEERQDQLVVLDYNDTFRTADRVCDNWSLETIYIRSTFEEELVPGFWVVTTSPLDLTTGPVYPPHFWDSNTRILQPTRLQPTGAKYLASDQYTGTITCHYVRQFANFSAQGFIVILGTEIKHTRESAPFCAIVPGGKQDLPSSPEALENFRVPSTPLCFYDKMRRLYSLCFHEDITFVVESRILSGREMFLVRAFYSDKPPADLQDKRFHANPRDEPLTLPLCLNLSCDLRGQLIQ